MTLEQEIRRHKALVGHALPAAVHDDVLRVQAAVVAVLDLHPAKVVWTGDVHCDRCVDSYEDPVLYPCPTVQAIANALGIPS